MKIYSILIADDEEPAHIILEEYCKSLNWVGKVHHAYDGLEAFQIVQKQWVDILLLDIEMPKMTGLEMAEQLHNPPVIILTTAYPEFALESYKIEALDYLLKPIPIPRFLASMDRAKTKLDQKSLALATNTSQMEKTHTWIRVDKVDVKLNIKDILWLQADDDYIKIYTSQRETPYMIHGRISVFIESLGTLKIVQIHRSYGINSTHINAIEGNQVRIGDLYIPIGKTYRAIIEKLL
jgi:DNA-binding LytR/AlgR family response regulator